MGLIPLTENKFAQVDDADLETLTKFHWWTKKDRRPGKFYAETIIVENGKKKTLLMHRVLLQADSNQAVDHKNGDGLDNRRANLRFATKSQNGANRQVNRNKTQSKFKGVRWHSASGKWQARLCQKSLGYFESEKQAALAYNAAALEKYGEFAYVNAV